MATFTELAYDLANEVRDFMIALNSGILTMDGRETTFHSLRSRIANVWEEAVFHKHPRKANVKYAHECIVEASAFYRRYDLASEGKFDQNDWRQMVSLMRRCRSKLMSFVGCNHYLINYTKICKCCETELLGFTWMAGNFPSQAAAMEHLEKRNDKSGYRIEVVSAKQVEPGTTKAVEDDDD